jgi:hypothetical protein
MTARTVTTLSMTVSLSMTTQSVVTISIMSLNTENLNRMTRHNYSVLCHQHNDILLFTIILSAFKLNVSIVRISTLICIFLWAVILVASWWVSLGYKSRYQIGRLWNKTL